MNFAKIALPALAAMLLLNVDTASSQVVPAAAVDTAEGITWMTWEEAQQRSKVEPRKIVLDIYADWCDMCMHMENNTFRHPDLARYVNQHFYPVKLNAQEKEAILYKQKNYQFIRKGKVAYHELAAELLRGRLSYPAVVFLNEDMDVIQSFIGYKTAAQFEKIATYFGSDLYKRTPWATFQRTYTPCIAEE